ncbi:MAG: flavodoxin domain-containing protein [Proteobacteria bacterium]|nr:flavodoxin domain-containing protein [Pseudomonadota bacterium]MDA1331749.1 flavodoxin domain-containing protein [Pseudomonadota bacterium]
MTKQIKILIGTMTGNAQSVAKELELRFDGEGIQVDTVDMDKLTTDIFDPDSIYLICTSTYGQGDVPDNARGLIAALKESKPNLQNIRYGLIALGDRTYAETFCFGGKHFDDVLRQCGAERIGDILMHDASSGTMPEEEAADWSEGWLKLCDLVFSDD